MTSLIPQINIVNTKTVNHYNEKIKKFEVGGDGKTI